MICLIKESDIVLHLASIAEPAQYMTNPKKIITIAALASIDIIDLCEKWYFDPTAKEVFHPQPFITYIDALDILLNKDCCFGVYDFKSKFWRAAVYMNHWDKNQRIMVRYIQDEELDPNVDLAKFYFDITIIRLIRIAHFCLLSISTTLITGFRHFHSKSVC